MQVSNNLCVIASYLFNLNQRNKAEIIFLEERFFLLTLYSRLAASRHGLLWHIAVALMRNEEQNRREKQIKIALKNIIHHVVFYYNLDKEGRYFYNNKIESNMY